MVVCYCYDLYGHKRYALQLVSEHIADTFTVFSNMFNTSSIVFILFIISTDHLSMLIKEAKGRGIDFIYAISPGLDITFSNQKEASALKRKLDQVLSFCHYYYESCFVHKVAALGCSSFAILFDDIDPDLSVADSKVFPSCAHAQATLANEVYSHLDNPNCFLFCPTGTACGNILYV